MVDLRSPVEMALDLLAYELRPFVEPGLNLKLKSGKTLLEQLNEERQRQKRDLYPVDINKWPPEDLVGIMMYEWNIFENQFDQSKIEPRHLRSLTYARKGDLNRLHYLRNKWAHREDFNDQDVISFLHAAYEVLIEVGAEESARLVRDKLSHVNAALKVNGFDTMRAPEQLTESRFRNFWDFSESTLGDFGEILIGGWRFFWNHLPEGKYSEATLREGTLICYRSADGAMNSILIDNGEIYVGVCRVGEGMCYLMLRGLRRLKYKWLFLRTPSAITGHLLTGYIVSPGEELVDLSFCFSQRHDTHVLESMEIFVTETQIGSGLKDYIAGTKAAHQIRNLPEELEEEDWRAFCDDYPSVASLAKTAGEVFGDVIWIHARELIAKLPLGNIGMDEEFLPVGQHLREVYRVSWGGASVTK